MLLKKGWLTMSRKPFSPQPSRSAGFLLRKPFNTDAAFTDSDLGIRIVFSRITWNEVISFLYGYLLNVFL